MAEMEAGLRDSRGCLRCMVPEAGRMLPSVDKGVHAPSAVFWRLAALTSIGVRPVRLIPLPCQPPKDGTWGPKEFCASDL